MLFSALWFGNTLSTNTSQQERILHGIVIKTVRYVELTAVVTYSNKFSKFCSSFKDKSTLGSTVVSTVCIGVNV